MYIVHFKHEVLFIFLKFYGAISAKLSSQLVFAALARSYQLIVSHTLSSGGGGGSNVHNFNISLFPRERALSNNQQTLKRC